jgi:uncharacterized protein YndB with AHSA1/START domain
MNILLWIIIVLVGIIVFFLIIGLFIRKDYSVSREVLVNKTKATVFQYLKLLKNQNQWSVWGSMDPDMRTTFTGIDGTEGFISAWESDNKNVGQGAQEILKIVEGERIDYEIRFLKPFKSTSWAFLTVASSNEQTLVHWEFTGKMNFPANLMMLFMNMEKMVGNDFEKGLQNLKTILEK